MRNLRRRRYFKFLLTMMLFACLALFIEDRIESLLPQLKTMVESKIEESFNGRFKLSIGNIEGGILHPIAFNDITILDAKGGELLSSVRINSIKTSYRVWEIFTKRDGKTSVADIISKDSFVYVHFVLKDRNVSGFARLGGDPKNATAKGSITFRNSEKMDFAATLNDGAYDLELNTRFALLKIKGDLSNIADADIFFSINHYKFHTLDIVCEGTIKNKMLGKSSDLKNNIFEGEIETQTLIVNYAPFLNIKASYRIQNGVLELPSLMLDNDIRLTGKTTLKEPYNVEGELTVNNVNLNWLLTNFGIKSTTTAASGTLNAKCKFSGYLKNLKYDVNLDVRKGVLSALEFDYLSAHLKGEGPIFRIEESRIVRESGYFALAGEMDLRKIGKNSIFKDVTIITDDRAITWDSWQTERLQGGSEVSMQKKITKDVDVGFKKFLNEKMIDESARYKDELQLEYKLHPNDSLKVTVGQDKNFFGLEHKDKF